MIWQERLLLAWIAPRGIVAVSVAGVFASRMSEQGHSGADLLLPLIVSLVLVTVVLHGSTIGWLSRRLGLAAASQNGIIIVGASKWSTEFAIRIKEMNIPVLIADSGWDNLIQGRLSGVRTYYGEILSEDAEVSLELNDMGFLLATTANDAYNAFVCSRFAADFGRTHVFQLPLQTASDAPEKKSIKLAHRGIIVFGPTATREEIDNLPTALSFRSKRHSARFRHSGALLGFTTRPNLDFGLRQRDNQHENQAISTTGGLAAGLSDSRRGRKSLICPGADLDRFHLVMDTIDRLPQTGDEGVSLKQRLKDTLVEHRQYINKHGRDLPEMRDWTWKG